MKNKKASKKARGKLRQSYQYLKENKPQEFYASLHTALEGYIEDKLSIPHSDMQKENIACALSDRKIEKEQIDKFIELLDECEMIRYSPNPQSFDMKHHYDKATGLIQYFENKL